MELETWKNIFQYLTYTATILVLVFSILTEVFTKKIQEREKEKSAKIEVERDNAIKKSNENAEALFRFNTFLGEIDNKVETCYLIIDLGSSPIKDQFYDFSCYLYFESFDILYHFSPLKQIDGLSKQILFVNTKAVKGIDIKNNPFISNEQHNFKNISEIIFDLRLFHKFFPNDLKIRDFFNTYFRLSFSEKHVDMIKNIKLNVNHWNIFDFSITPNNWKKSTEKWIEPSIKHSMLYNKYQTRHYEALRINYMTNGVSRYEIYSRSYNNESKINFEQLLQVLSGVNPDEGTLEINIDNRWLEKNNNFINYLQPIEKDGFALQIFRDIDNVLKVIITNSFSNKISLKCNNLELFATSQNEHSLVVTWGNGVNNLYINGKPIDTNKGNK